MTIARERDWPVRFVLFLVTFLGLLIGVPTTLSASCKGAAEISSQQITTLRNLLSPATAPGDFHVYAETPSADRRAYFILYSITKAADSSAHTVYLAATGLEPQQNILSAYDASAYLPPFARAVSSQPDANFLGAPHNSGSGSPAVDVDGCLNAFVLQPDLQAVHMNLFARSPRHGNEGATDVVFVLLDHSSLRPVLELNQSSWYEPKGLQRDSVIAVLPSTAMATDLIWWQSSQQGGGMMEASYGQNRWYRWNGKGFEKMGTLEETVLAVRLQSAFRFTRSNAISAVEMKLTVPRAGPPPR